MIKIVSKEAGFGINIPTKREELTKEYFDEVLKNVKLAKNYCIIALVYRDTLFSLMNTKDTTVTVLPIIAKISDEDVSSTGYQALQQAILDRTDIERGHHLYLNSNIISPAYINGYIKSDKALVQDIISGKIYKDNNIDQKSCNVYTTEFKIVPIVNVRATIDHSIKVENPFCIR